MIIRKEKILSTEGMKKQVIKFALFPVLLKRSATDQDGEIIWLEKYVINYYTVRPMPATEPNRWDWVFQNSVRFTKSVLTKFED